jgi:hypothetical protein
MATSSTITTFRDPAFSLLQSAIHATLLKHQAQGRIALPKGRSGLAVTADHDYMAASVQAMQAFQNPPASAAQPRSVVGTVLDCAKIIVEIAWDELFAKDKVAALKNELAFSTCDPFWAECLAEYEGYILAGQTQPYIPYTDISQFVVPNCFPDTTQIALIADWGTGENDALVLLQQIAANFNPDVLIHLGDIYYSGLVSEDSGHFTSLIAHVWPNNPPLVFTLDGNHDRYAGASGGYYPMIAALNQADQVPQPNSYFALRNNFWQFVAMDTGYHDVNPFTVDSNLTYLEPAEIAWHLDKIRNNGAGVDTGFNPSGVRGTIVLSHHQLLSFVGVGNNSNGQPLAINPNLSEPFAPVFNLIDFWLWGHEHNLCIFQPYTMAAGQPLPPCRCIGAGAIPMLTPQAPPPANLVIPASETAPPQIVPGTGLGNNGTVFHHAYAIVSLNNAAISISYYQVDSTNATPGNPPALTPVPFQDNLAAPAAANVAASSGAAI